MNEVYQAGGPYPEPRGATGCLFALMVVAIFIVGMVFFLSSCSSPGKLANRQWKKGDRELADSYYTVKENWGNGCDQKNRRELDSIVELLKRR